MRLQTKHGNKIGKRNTVQSMLLSKKSIMPAKIKGMNKLTNTNFVKFILILGFPFAPHFTQILDVKVYLPTFILRQCEETKTLIARFKEDYNYVRSYSFLGLVLLRHRPVCLLNSQLVTRV
jgi:hypothetical protein